MDDRDWLILQLLYQEKNITKAAKLLYISQPALTNRLQQMEKEFGVQIVNRGRRGIHFTPQGEYLAKSADKMIAHLQHIKDHVLNMGDKLTGTLRLGVSNFFTDYKLPGLLRLFKDKYPDVEFKVTTGWSSDVVNLLHHQDVHIAFVKGDYNWRNEKRLIFEETVCIASKTPIELNDLPRLPRIDYHQDRFLKTAVDHWWSENFNQPPSVSIHVDKADTCKKMVENGLGYAMLPHMLVEDVEGLHVIPMQNEDGTALLRKTWMYFHEESLEIKIVKAFIEFIEEIDLHDIH
ncbi:MULTISPECIES: LysR family transcriptional regulator [Priestia]|uniref:LysR family transcriptional regulator n=1 Tax=Priestia veravalensis TaxID=1414648 RepID=A0A0V8JNC4_9BACI|nr:MULTISPECIES: LysR family transcriptional regulator [Priestia]KSU88564.1 LysR family transcriptional regulator [Priestia veravalensis]MBY6086126.1 LysR family transcriptional regulator [Priestia flexa]MCG7313842.1 LysR family transcriptional regulator [Priestia flexa]MED4590095.1 LysR family transcriptional regulator [Priestia flexa]SCC09853.1 DNA-binding transcriptional regulator, LysR family [Priestia flexa]